MIAESYLEKVYAGFLGMNAGIRLGAPVEPVEWTAERIQQIYGDVRGYLKEYRTFSADDDVNGPVFFMRALYDDAISREMTADDVGKAWLNYCREGIGMIWWGGSDVSTEHRAYENLVKGVRAPRSGSIDVNGLLMAEQIGGQIFVDTWGLLFPGDIEKAARFAELAASVSHDGNGLYGARFIAACIAKAYVAESVEEILSAGLSVIPIDCTYAQVVKAVIQFHKKGATEFRDCLKFLQEEWGYDKYGGVCHIIPNAGVCVLALLYGEGDFARSIEIATMCGWDTDCNAGSVGSILGVLVGLKGIPDHYRKPLNDCIITSSVAGYLNIVDAPTFAKEVVLLGYRLAGVKAPCELVESVKQGEIYFNFELPGSTHGFRTNNSFKTLIRHSETVGEGSLEVIFDRMVEGNSSKIFYKPFYRRADFSDEKYKPVFAPQAYSGQIVSATIYLDKWQGEDILVTPYVRNSFNRRDIHLHTMKLTDRTWNDLTFVIPNTHGALIDEIGYIVESPSPLKKRALGTLYIDNFHIYGAADYYVDFSKQSEEFLSVTPFSHHKGEWSLTGNALRCACEEEAFSFTGNYYHKDVSVEAEIEPLNGFSHLLITRAPGIKRQYLAGFDGEGKVSLLVNDFGLLRLLSVPFEWELRRKYLFRFVCTGDLLEFFVDDVRLLSCRDGELRYGMVGIGLLEKGECIIHQFKVKG